MTWPAQPPVKNFPLASEPAYYFHPIWSPDSKKIAFHDNRLHTYLLDLTTGKLTTVGEPNVYGGFSDTSYAVSWSPDSKWLAYTRSMDNHLHALFLYSLDTGQSTQLTSQMADSTVAGLRPRRQISLLHRQHQRRRHQ